MRMKRVFEMNKNIFDHFRRAFIEPSKKIFSAGESPTLKLVASSLREVLYLQIELSGKGTYINESMILKYILSVLIFQISKVHFISYRK